MKVFPSSFQSIRTFVLLLLFIGTLQSCVSYQYYTENSDGIYSSNPYAKNNQRGYNNNRAFSEGIADLDLNETLEDEILFEEEQDTQENRIQEARNGNVYVNIGAGYNYWDPFWNSYWDPYWGWNYGFARPFGLNYGWNWPYYSNFHFGNYWGWNYGFVAPLYHQQRRLFTPRNRYYGRRNSRRIAYSNNHAHARGHRKTYNRVSSSGRRAVANTPSYARNSSRRTTNHKNTTYRRSSASSTHKNATQRKQSSNYQKSNNYSRSYRSSSNSNDNSRSYGQSRSRGNYSGGMRSSSSGRSSSSRRR